MPRKARSICFVTGTRAESGLMRPVLEAIKKTKSLRLQIVATGMHLSTAHGNTLQQLRREFRIDAVAAWKRATVAESTGHAIAELARIFAKLKPDVVIIVGDRAEAFAAATAAHLQRIPIAHIHGGDRALGQVDDSLRHALTKLAHIHFPATSQSAHRLQKMGEDRWRIFKVGSPAVDGILNFPYPGTPGEGQGGGSLTKSRPFALVILHPVDANEKLEYQRAQIVIRAVTSQNFQKIVVIHPNNDPGHRGIARCWNQLPRHDRFITLKNVPRGQFLALLRDAAILVGNSSSGIIEAASFATPVVDIGPRQLGRQRGRNVVNVPYRLSPIQLAIKHLAGKRIHSPNPYGKTGAGVRIARVLSNLPLNGRLLQKIISY